MPAGSLFPCPKCEEQRELIIGARIRLRCPVPGRPADLTHTIEDKAAGREAVDVGGEGPVEARGRGARPAARRAQRDAQRCEVAVNAPVAQATALIPAPAALAGDAEAGGG